MNMLLSVHSLAVLAALALAGCSVAGDRAACCAAIPPAAPSGKTLSALDAEWESDTGAKLRLSDLKGRVQVVSLFYSSCHITCPLTLLSMRQVEAALPAEVRARTGFVFITFVPENDSARVLHRFRAEQNLSARWTLLRGSNAATRGAADLLGVSFLRDSYRLSHSPQIAVLDAEGRIFFRQRNLHATPAALVAAVQSASPAKALAHSSP